MFNEIQSVTMLVLGFSKAVFFLFLPSYMLKKCDTEMEYGLIATSCSFILRADVAGFVIQPVCRKQCELLSPATTRARDAREVITKGYALKPCLIRVFAV
jgi:hypothetical protein